MKLPISLCIDALEGFSVCHFKDLHHQKEAPAHYYVVIPTVNSAYLIFCLITSKVAKICDYYTKSNPACLKSIVNLKPSNLSFLKCKSIINCNSAQYIHRNALKKVIKEDTYDLIVKRIPSDLINIIISAIDSSPMIKPFTKKAIDRTEINN